MSFLGKMFGKGSKDDPKRLRNPSPIMDTIEKLNNVEELLNKKQEYLEGKIQAELAIIKANGLKNKRTALQALRRKKRYEKQLKQLDGTLATIELQKEALEGARTNTEICDTMKMASEALKVTHKNLNLDMVQDIMDDISEQQEAAQEISEAISKPYNFSGYDDEEELERELEELEQEELDKELMAIGMVPADLPSVPKEDVPSASRTAPSEEEEELKKLQQWAS